MEEHASELIASADGGDPGNDARQLTPPLNPAPCTTRDPRRAWERFAVGLVWLDDGRKAVACSVPLEPGQSLWLLGQSLLMAPPAGAACQGRRNRRARRGRGGRTGVVLEEAEDDDNVPVTVDEADDDVEVDDLA